MHTQQSKSKRKTRRGQGANGVGCETKRSLSPLAAASHLAALIFFFLLFISSSPSLPCARPQSERIAPPLLHLGGALARELDLDRVHVVPDAAHVLVGAHPASVDLLGVDACFLWVVLVVFFGDRFFVLVGFLEGIVRTHEREGWREKMGGGALSGGERSAGSFSSRPPLGPRERESEGKKTPKTNSPSAGCRYCTLPSGNTR